jgi:hypothetical protein
MGSSGSSARSDAVISAAIFHPGLTRRVSRMHRPTRMTWVSSGITSLAAETRVHTPTSTASWRTIHRKNRFSRLQPLPAEGRGKKY